MNLSAFYQECVQKKEELKISSKDISEQTMLSQSTVSRFFKNNGEGLSFSALCAIGEVLGVEMPIGKSPFPDTGNPSATMLLQKIEELYEDRLYKHGKLYENMLAAKDAQLKSKEEELKKSEGSRAAHLIINIVTVAIFAILLFIDLATPLVGWIRY